MAPLNPAQYTAVNTLSGPLLVLAGAGTGKTRVVTFRIAKLIKHGTSPDRILAVTFTNKAALEMQDRVGELLGRKKKVKPEISTFHSLCVKILRRNISKLGYPKKFAICDRGDQESVARQVLREIKISGDLLRPGDLLYQISSWKSAAIRPDEAATVAMTDKEHLAAIAYRRYQKALKLKGAVDFDDLLLCTEDLFVKHPEIRDEEAQRFDHLLVDEYQDTNGSQYRIVAGLAQHHRNLCVVGDDDQSIYGWRGAEVKHILRFGRDWKDAKIVRLEDNYRSTSEILTLANRLITFNKFRHEKKLIAARQGGLKPRIRQFPNEAKEAVGTIQDIQSRLQQKGIEPRDIAILFRTNEQPRPFETALRKAQLPYVLIGGTSFFDRKEVRDMLAYLRVIDSPEDEVSLLRIINTPPRGIGQKAVEQLLDAAVQKGVPLWQVIKQPETCQGITANAKRGLTNLVGLIRDYQHKLQSGRLGECTESLIQRIQYREELQRLYPDPNEQEARWATVEQVVNTLAEYEREASKPSMSDFLDDVTLGGREFDNEKDKQLARNAIMLMTLHSAKGLEFPEVYMVGMEEGILPHHRSVAADGEAIDEERRLCYVGVTRAQERLTLSLPLTRMKWGKPRDTLPSRFLYEMTGQADNPVESAKLAKEARKRRDQRGATRS